MIELKCLTDYYYILHMITYFIPIYNEHRKNKNSFTLFVKKLKNEINKDNKNHFIIVDDGSSDKSPEIIENLIKTIKKKK